MDIVVPYEPNDKQKIFHSCPAEEVVYGGAKGGGKSCALVMEALAYALEYSGAELYLFRETYDDLEANIIKEWKEKVPQELYKYNETKHTANVIGGSTVYFRYIKNKTDAEKYNGRSIDWIGVDELTKHEEESIQILLSCLRSPKGFPPRFRGTCNPGGIGHVWVKKRYIQATGYGKEMAVDPVTGNRIAFIPAKVYDNPVLMKNDPAYVRRLENLPPAKRKAYLEGDWDAYEGQAFEEWNPEIHVCRPFIIPEYWYRWRSVDNGYSDPFAWYWFAVDTDGIVYIYREFTRGYDDPKLAYSEQARRVVELTGNEQIRFTAVGHEAFGTHPLSEGKTIVDHYREGGVADCVKVNPDRRLRKAIWHEYLKPFYDENKKRMTARVQIFGTCKKLIETLPQQVEDEDDPEKVAETDYDHWYDGAGFGLIAWHSRNSLKPPEPKKEVPWPLRTEETERKGVRVWLKW
jgi:hypothetical protein